MTSADLTIYAAGCVLGALLGAALAALVNVLFFGRRQPPMPPPPSPPCEERPGVCADDLLADLAFEEARAVFWADRAEECEDALEDLALAAHAVCEETPWLAGDLAEEVAFARSVLADGRYEPDEEDDHGGENGENRTGRPV